MKLTLLFFTFFIFPFISCTSNKNNSSNGEKTNRINSSSNTIDYSKKPYNDSLVFHIGNEDKSWYSLKFEVDMSKAESLKEIKFYRERKLIQKIQVNKFIENERFELIDWNFDGYKDITAIENIGSGGTTYWIWNYSPITKKYVYNTLLSGYTGLEIDSLSKYIVFHHRSGYREESWDTSRYVNNKLVFVKGLYQERWSDQRGNSWIKKTRTKMVHGIRKITSDSTISND